MARLAELQRRAATLPADEAHAHSLADYFAEAQKLTGQGWWGQLHFLLEDAHAAGIDGLVP